MKLSVKEKEILDGFIEVQLRRVMRSEYANEIYSNKEMLEKQTLWEKEKLDLLYKIKGLIG